MSAPVPPRRQTRRQPRRRRNPARIDPAGSGPSTSDRRTPVTVRAGEPRDVLASLPYLLGYRPERSVVLVALAGGGSSQVGPVLRVDVEPVADDPLGGGAHLSRLLVGVGGTRVFLAVYCDQDLPWLMEFVAALVAGGLQILDGWQITGTDFWPLTDPAAVESLQALEASRISAELVLAGISPRATRADLLPCLDPVGEADRVRVEELIAEITPLDRATRRVAIGAWVRCLDADTDEPPSGRDTVLMLAGLADPLVRDAVLVAAVTRSSRRELAVLAADGDLDILDRVFHPKPGASPNLDRVDRAGVLLGHLTRWAQPGYAGYPLAVLAWVAWWSGDGAMANQAVERARAADPTNRLAALVDTSLAAGVAPPWVKPTPAAKGA